MFYTLAADVVVLVHFLFIVFAILGGFLALRWKRAVFIHLPAMAWAAMIMFTGWICPLTPLENQFRKLAGQEGYEGVFIVHYLVPLIYPEDLTRGFQILAGLMVLIINVIAYGVVWKKARKPGSPT